MATDLIFQGKKPKGYQKAKVTIDIKGLTWLQESITRLGTKPRLAILRVIQFGNESKVAGDLPVIGYQETLPLKLSEFHILKCELQDRKRQST